VQSRAPFNLVLRESLPIRFERNMLCHYFRAALLEDESLNRYSLLQ